MHNIGIRNQFLVDALYRLFVHGIYNRCDYVVCPSQFARRQLRRHGPRTPSAVVSNGVPAEYRPRPHSRRDGKFVILSVGRLAPEKRHDVLIEAVRSSRHEPRVQLVILGDGPLRDRLRALASSLTNSAVFDCLPAPELIPYYTDADLYVHTAEVEVEGMAVLEAMGCGLPCLIATSPTSATAQFARSALFRFPAGSSKAFTASIDHWIEHPDELAAARADHSEAARNYHIDTSLDRLLGVYQKVLSRTDPSAT